MNRYNKIIDVTGQYYTKEYIKIKHHKNKTRVIKEETVMKTFLEGDAEVLVIFPDTGKEILIDYFSDPELIEQYLGRHFLPK